MLMDKRGRIPGMTRDNHIVRKIKLCKIFCQFGKYDAFFGLQPVPYRLLPLLRQRSEISPELIRLFFAAS